MTDSNKILVVTASDGNFRIYSWNTWTGGSMHYFQTVFQWRQGGRTHLRRAERAQNDPGSFVSKIYTVDINDVPHYLAITNGIYSGKDARQSIVAYVIGAGALQKTAIFDTGKKRVTSIDVDYDFFSVVDHPERPVALITYDETAKTVSLPVVNTKGSVTSAFLRYQLKGDRFLVMETGK